MFCTHCKYTSFDYLPSCPLCGRDWTSEKKALNLDWLVASAPEGKHQRQVDQGEANVSFAASASETWSASLQSKPDIKQPTAPSSQSYPPQDLEEGHTAQGQPRDQKQSHISNTQDFNENELDFPELDELLQTQNPSGPQPPPSGSTVQDTPDRSKSNPSDVPAGPKQEDEDNDFLDLSSLVHDLDLDMDESDNAKTYRNQGTSSHSSPHKSPRSG
ncbi:MAG: hypothetical protein KGY41_00230 [Desulfovermiculus sp.]|nr:hypothetical protein [Desulfovermiculus sp.]